MWCQVISRTPQHHPAAPHGMGKRAGALARLRAEDDVAMPLQWLGELVERRRPDRPLGDDGVDIRPHLHREGRAEIEWNPQILLDRIAAAEKRLGRDGPE